MSDPVLVYGGGGFLFASGLQGTGPATHANRDPSDQTTNQFTQAIQQLNQVIDSANFGPAFPVGRNFKTARSVLRQVIDQGIDAGILPVKQRPGPDGTQRVDQKGTKPRFDPTTADPILRQLAALAASPPGGLVPGSLVFVQVDGVAIPVRVTPALIRRLQQVTGDPMLLPMTRRDP